MAFELFIALRYLFGRRKQAFISVISWISVAGVALGVASLIIVIGVMNGFSTDLRTKILGANAHVMLLSVNRAFTDHAAMAAKAETVPGVREAVPFVYAEAMLSYRRGAKGVALRGIDPSRPPGMLGPQGYLVQGDLASLADDSGLPGIIIGQELAEQLGLTLGARVHLLSPAGQKTAAGFAPKVAPFRVVGIFSTGMFEYDTTLAYTTMASASRLMGLEGDVANGLEIRVNDVYKAREIGDAVVAAAGGYPFYARNWMDMNENLFAALKLEKTAMFVILVLIVLVGSFSIVTTLIMLVMEKTKDIAILMSMGATRGSIGRIFMLQGTIIGAMGTTLGYAIGLPASLLLEKYQFIKLPEDVYWLDHLPVLLEWTDLTAIGVVAMLLCFVATVHPARQASKLEPAEALRYE